MPRLGRKCLLCGRVLGYMPQLCGGRAEPLLTVIREICTAGESRSIGNGRDRARGMPEHPDSGAKFHVDKVVLG